MAIPHAALLLPPLTARCSQQRAGCGGPRPGDGPTWAAALRACRVKVGEISDETNPTAGEGGRQGQQKARCRAIRASARAAQAGEPEAIRLTFDDLANHYGVPPPGASGDREPCRNIPSLDAKQALCDEAIDHFAQDTRRGVPDDVRRSFEVLIVAYGGLAQDRQRNSPPTAGGVVALQGTGYSPQSSRA